MNRANFSFILISFLLSLCSCTSFEKQDVASLYQENVSMIKHQVVRKNKYNNPDFYDVFGKRYYILPTNYGYSKVGIASWYGAKFHNRLTSSKERYDLYKMTAAHKTLPLPTYAKVTNLENGKKIVVKINDRGPFVGDRLIDLSYGAAKELGFVDKGTTLVRVEAVEPFFSLDSHKKRELYLQVGVYSNLEHAKHVLQDIEKSGIIPCKIYHDKSNSEASYKVQIGPIRDFDSTSRLVKNAGFADLMKIIK